MLKINMEFKRGILFIRLDGSLDNKTIDKFDNEVLSLILNNGLKNIVINFDKVYNIDKKGIDELINLSEIVSGLNGKATLCSITNKEVKRLINNHNTFDFYETQNELTALGVMKI